VLSTFPKFKSLGFSLVELMVGITIMGILAVIAVPSFQTWTQNAQIRNAAESVTNGLQKARAEAVARNANVSFTLGAGTSWTVGVVAPASVIEQRFGNDGSKDVTRTVLPAGATTITFNTLGGVVLPTNADGSVPFSQVDLTAAGGSLNLRVTIGVNGNARMCDPNLAPGSSPRAC